MKKIWNIMLCEKEPSRTNTDRYFTVRIVSGEEGKTVDGRGSTPIRAYSSACSKLVIKPFLEPALFAEDLTDDELQRHINECNRQIEFRNCVKMAED